MAICVLLRKESETERDAIYFFGPDEGRFGKWMIDKRSGEIELLEPIPGDRTTFYSSRAASRLEQHFKKGEFPDETMYAT